METGGRLIIIFSTRTRGFGEMKIKKKVTHNFRAFVNEKKR